MSVWVPSLDGRTGPRYLALADAIGEAMGAGVLQAGARLPTHRDLAAMLGVTVGTVSRGYAEAERRGLTVGEVGRGTFVRPHDPGLGGWSVHPTRPGVIDLSLSVPVALEDGSEGEALARSLREIAGRPDAGELLRYYHQHSAAPIHRRTGAQWIGRRVPGASPDRLVVTAGAQHGMTAVFAAITRPGDLVLTEELTYPGMKALARMFGLRLRGLPMDGEGITPEGLERACDIERPAAVYVLPTIQNPTTAVMSVERRASLARITLQRGLTLVEDDVHGWLHPDPPPTITSMVPENSVYLASSSKPLAAGLRIGWALVPDPFVDRLLAAVRGTVWMAPPLMAEVTARWIADGTAERIMSRKRDETRARQAMAQEALAGYDVRTNDHSYHLWLLLPERWRGQDFAAALAQRGVLVASAEAFAVGHRDVPHAVRVCVGAAQSRKELSRGLMVIRDVLDGCADPLVSLL